MGLTSETHKFAHISDCHLGSWRSPKLRELNLRTFEQAVERCASEGVDFIIITGDFFDVNVPDLAPVKKAVEILKAVKERGIGIYLIYGSHDFSPNSVSMIDILHSAGLFRKPTDGEMIDGRLKLDFIVDGKTGAAITGLSGRSRGLDVPLYESLDRAGLEAREGFKIFLIHAPISEVAPASMARGGSVPISSLPKGFGYYGAGHLHKRMEHPLPEGGWIVYPGPLFGATFTDLEETAMGEKRGFYTVTFDSEGVRGIRFNEVNVAEIAYRMIDANDKTARQVEEKVVSALGEFESANKVVLLKVAGTMSSGRRADIDFSKIEQSLMRRGALTWFINRNALSSRETTELRIKGASRDDIEDRIIKERVAEFAVEPTVSDWRVRNALMSRFAAEKGETLAKDLLRKLKTEKLENEKSDDFEGRVLREVRPALDPAELSNTAEGEAPSP